MNILVRLWQGSYPLPTAFWGFYILGYYGQRVLAALLLREMQPQLALPVGILAQTIDAAYLILTSVGVWRSANAHLTKPEQRGFSVDFSWGMAARLCVAGWGLRYVLRAAEAWTGLHFLPHWVDPTPPL
jgi:hypothetical protein